MIEEILKHLSEKSAEQKFFEQSEEEMMEFLRRKIQSKIWKKEVRSRLDALDKKDFLPLEDDRRACYLKGLESYPDGDITEGMFIGDGDEGWSFYTKSEVLKMYMWLSTKLDTKK